MGISVSGVEQLKLVLQKASKEAPANIFKRMQAEGKDLQTLARKMAPVDVGNLEDAISISTEGGGRGSDGRFLSKAISVFVDMDAPVEGRPGHIVGQYAYEMHEYLEPYGDYQLGEKSRAKQSGQSEEVGGGFMDRAAEQIEERLMERLIAVARRYL